MPINRTDLVAAIAEKANLTKTQADAAVAAFQETLISSLAVGEPVKLTGLFSVERVERKERMTRNLRTGEPVKVEARYGVKITPGASLKNALPPLKKK